MRDKLDQIVAEERDINLRLADPDVLRQPQEIQRLSQRLHEIKPIVETLAQLRQAEAELDDARSLIAEGDAALRAMAQDEVARLTPLVAQLQERLKLLLIPKDPNDAKNAILEIRAGTGGEEAALFAADLYRMYLRYAEKQHWKVEEISRSETGLDGLKEVIAVVEGAGAYARLKYEGGVHRVQRVPATEAQGRIHTSACTVAVLPEAEEIDVQINPSDLRIDTYRAQGAGGQHVNKTESAVRITHIPTGIVVASQEERSQHKNRANAMRHLRAKLRDALESRQHAERAAQRKSIVGSGDRSERIRTYNFPQNRVTDHRIELTLYKLDRFLEGDLDEMIDALVAADAAAKLAEAHS